MLVTFKLVITALLSRPTPTIVGLLRKVNQFVEVKFKSRAIEMWPQDLGFMDDHNLLWLSMMACKRLVRYLDSIFVLVDIKGLPNALMTEEAVKKIRLTLGHVDHVDKLNLKRGSRARVHILHHLVIQ
ncbi:hypothetical protein ACLB2K_077050 [Fragaria x ananassa]